MDIDYRINHPVTAEQFVALLKRTSLGARRPIGNAATIAGMLEHADLLITAWSGEELVGVARSVTDFHYCCYLSDLAVADEMQAKGIGKAMIRHTLEALHQGCKLILLAAPQATGYYPKLGFSAHSSAWTIASAEELV